MNDSNIACSTAENTLQVSLLYCTCVISGDLQVAQKQDCFVATCAKKFK